MSMFSEVTKAIKNTKFVIPIALAVLAGIIIGGFAFYEDYFSSRAGYAMLPTRKSSTEVVGVIALLPQVGQIIFFYMFGSTAEKLPSGRLRVNYWYFIIAFFLLLFDLGTDMFFKASGMGAISWAVAFVESVTVFTIGSELLITASLGLILELGPEALKQIAQMFAGLFGEDEEPGPAARSAHSQQHR